MTHDNPVRYCDSDHRAFYFETPVEQGFMCFHCMDAATNLSTPTQQYFREVTEHSVIPLCVSCGVVLDVEIDADGYEELMDTIRDALNQITNGKHKLAFHCVQLHGHYVGQNYYASLLDKIYLYFDKREISSVAKYAPLVVAFKAAYECLEKISYDSGNSTSS